MHRKIYSHKLITKIQNTYWKCNFEVTSILRNIMIPITNFDFMPSKCLFLWDFNAYPQKYSHDLTLYLTKEKHQPEHLYRYKTMNNSLLSQNLRKKIKGNKKNTWNQCQFIVNWCWFVPQHNYLGCSKPSPSINQILLLTTLYIHKFSKSVMLPSFTFVGSVQ